MPKTAPRPPLSTLITEKETRLRAGEPGPSAAPPSDAMAEKAGQAFRKADKDKSGKIEVKELRGALKLLGIDQTKKHVCEALAK